MNSNGCILAALTDLKLPKKVITISENSPETRPITATVPWFCWNRSRKRASSTQKAFGSSFVEAFQPGVYSGYIDKATSGTLENFQAFAKANPVGNFDFQHGADDDQLAAASRLAALTVRYWNDPKLLSIVERATRVCQNNNQTVAYMKFNAVSAFGTPPKA